MEQERNWRRELYRRDRPSSELERVEHDEGRRARLRVERLADDGAAAVGTGLWDEHRLPAEVRRARRRPQVDLLGIPVDADHLIEELPAGPPRRADPQHPH